MKNIYTFPALLSEDGKYICVRFPDLPGCSTFGENYADAVASAREALAGHLLCLEEEPEPIPEPTPIPEIKSEMGETLIMVDARTDILREIELNKSINKNVTLPSWLNKLAVEAKINFSSVLQEGLKAKLGI